MATLQSCLIAMMFVSCISAVELDIRYFVLGVVDYHLGGYTNARSPDKYIDLYVRDFYGKHLRDSPEATTLDSLISSHNVKYKNDNIKYNWVSGIGQDPNCENCREFIFLCSQQLSSFVTNCFHFTQQRRLPGRKVITRFYGELKDSIFIGTQSELSYLAGIFWNSGRIENGTYHIEAPVGLIKLDYTANVLKRLGADVYDFWHSPSDCLGGETGFTFKPTAEMLSYLNAFRKKEMVHADESKYPCAKRIERSDTEGNLGHIKTNNIKEK